MSATKSELFFRQDMEGALGEDLPDREEQLFQLEDYQRRAKILNQFFEKLRYKISASFMLKLYHGTAWEGNDMTVT